jgi:hypothetical protein
MQTPKNSDPPEEQPLLRINLAKEKIGWRKYKPLFSAIGEKVLIGILLVICIPFLPIIGCLYLARSCMEYRLQAAVKNGILTNELSASQKTTVYLSSRDISGTLGNTNIEYSQSAERASFNYGDGNGRYRVYGTREEGLFMLVPTHSKIDPEEFKYGSYYQCEVVRVNGGYNHGDFGEKYPMGSNDCIVLVCKKASKIIPSKNFIVITGSDAAKKQRFERQIMAEKRSADDERQDHSLRGARLKG